MMTDRNDCRRLALHQSALATITGTGLEGEGLFPRILRLLLALYSVVVFATVAGSLGAYFRSSTAARDMPRQGTTRGPAD
ncbi:hypothetical protein Q0F99_10425 [Rathayibacter oskolensis]|uniref:hypothetical protein n=1 Tax=Rathayibacter oskolensis TaxID=1891671 RepID=UPI00265F4013|nr:hypothetical protein [Rathayibacter oskolensis]WKK70315.1 hypothetical protein Q0F99_10425 [Rathayibacter oskolensis]